METTVITSAGAIGLRAVSPSDAVDIEDGFSRLSDQSRYQRFMSGMPRLSAAQLQRFTDIDQDRHVAVGAHLPHHPAARDPELGLGVGVARYAPVDPGRTAELAVAVSDAEHGRGIGTLLVQSLLVIAGSKGLEALEATTLSDNRPMRAVLEKLGAERVPRRDDDDLTVTRYVLPTAIGLESIEPRRRHELEALLPWLPRRVTHPDHDGPGGAG